MIDVFRHLDGSIAVVDTANPVDNGLDGNVKSPGDLGIIAQVKNNEPFPVFVRSSGYEHETRKFIVPSPHAAARGPVDPQRISQRRHHRHR